MFSHINKTVSSSMMQPCRWFSCHPLLEQRISKLKAIIEKTRYPGEKHNAQKALDIDLKKWSTKCQMRSTPCTECVNKNHFSTLKKADGLSSSERAFIIYYHSNHFSYDLGASIGRSRPTNHSGEHRKSTEKNQDPKSEKMDEPFDGNDIGNQTDPSAGISFKDTGIGNTPDSGSEDSVIGSVAKATAGLIGSVFESFFPPS
jgi:hypothetical protein